MNIRSFRIVPVTVSVIMTLATRVRHGEQHTPAAGQPDPGEADITVAAIPATDLAGLYIAQDQGAVRPAGAAREDRADTQQQGDHR
jgi:hypothetical protein